MAGYPKLKAIRGPGQGPIRESGGKTLEPGGLSDSVVLLVQTGAQTFTFEVIGVAS